MEMLKMSAAVRYGETSGCISTAPTLSWLPDSVLLEVLSFLSVRDLIRSCRVCKRWKRLILDKSLWRYVDLTPYKLNSKILWHLVRHWLGASLQTLKLKGLLKSVKKQEFLTPAILQVLEKRYPSLEYLHLQETNLRSLGYDCLPSTLKTLELSECEIPLTWFKTKGKTKDHLKLENLVLNKVSSFSNQHLEIVCSQSSLKSLCLSGTYRINDVGVQKAVPFLKGLEHLKLNECNITDITLHLIGCHLKHLQTLALLDFRYLTDAGLACLSGVKTLEKLWLDYCIGFSSRSIVTVSISLPVLNYLSLNGILFESQGIDEIRKSLPHCTVNNAFSSMDNGLKNK
ncbi:LOW QUALITY PROTEIN: F-box/LRR-repeat protein 12 [Anomaloglossus baeobatrachus]|uniref:LOW QUALITY PROTEIN: F-box/LRR-repeat protein 12 n=1 Tax=Anomaloglossus baeobatrachus TaxID=238106 RepID=UPI003F503AD0